MDSLNPTPDHTFSEPPELLDDRPALPPSSPKPTLAPSDTASTLGSDYSDSEASISTSSIALCLVEPSPGLFFLLLLCMQSYHHWGRCHIYIPHQKHPSTSLVLTWVIKCACVTFKSISPCHPPYRTIPDSGTTSHFAAATRSVSCDLIYLSSSHSATSGFNSFPILQQQTLSLLLSFSFFLE